MEFRFTNEIPASQVDHVVDFALGPRLWVPDGNYPDELDWAEKAHTEIKGEVKRPMVVFDSRELVGNIIYQRDKVDPTALEIKRISVMPSARGRGVAGFLLRQAEIEGQREFGTTVARGDAKVSNVPMRKFLLTQGYRIIGKADLYGLGAGEDYIYEKPLTPKSRKR